MTKQLPAPTTRTSVTPAMIDAGITAWVAWDQSEDASLENLVTSVFQAMMDHQGSKKHNSNQFHCLVLQ